jgi:hypothetical protein
MGWLKRGVAGQRKTRHSSITIADRAREAQQWEVATRHYRTALGRNPSRAPIWVQYGHTLKESGKLAEAEDAYRRALALDTTSADTHLQIGHLLKLQGRVGEARRAYLRAAVLDPSQPDPARELASLGWSEGQLRELGQILGSADPRSDAAPRSSTPGESSSRPGSGHDGPGGAGATYTLADPRRVGPLARSANAQQAHSDPTIVPRSAKKDIGKVQAPTPANLPTLQEAAIFQHVIGTVQAQPAPGKQPLEEPRPAAEGQTRISARSRVTADRGPAAPDVQIAERGSIKLEIELIRKSGLFDQDYYLERYPEVKDSGIDPLLHFFTIGAKQGKNPNEYFDTNYYALQMQELAPAQKMLDVNKITSQQ